MWLEPQSGASVDRETDICWREFEMKRMVRTIAVTGTAAALAIGGGVAGAGTALADSQQNVVTSTGNSATPDQTIGQFGTNLSQNLGKVGTNLLVNAGTAGSNAQQNLGQTGTDLMQNGGEFTGNLTSNAGKTGGNLTKNVGKFGGNLVKNIGRALSGNG
ncbi:hypothetical protein ACXPWS_28625 [Mycobacterium sp. BMJ-28]